MSDERAELKPLAERLRDVDAAALIVTLEQWLAESNNYRTQGKLMAMISALRLLTEAADALDPPPTPVDPALYAWDDYP